jgi:hypothetical protein
MSSRFKEQR